MFSIFGFILIFIIFIILFGVSVIASILRALFGFGRKSTFRTSQGQRQTEEDRAEQEAAQPKKKIFEKTEGEYVDFEEIKEDKK